MFIHHFYAFDYAGLYSLFSPPYKGRSQLFHSGLTEHPSPELLLGSSLLPKPQLLSFPLHSFAPASPGLPSITRTHLRLSCCGPYAIVFPHVWNTLPYSNPSIAGSITSFRLNLYVHLPREAVPDLLFAKALCHSLYAPFILFFLFWGEVALITICTYFMHLFYHVAICLPTITRKHSESRCNCFILCFNPSDWHIVDVK